MFVALQQSDEDTGGLDSVAARPLVREDSDEAPATLGSLKAELAAELLLSDSGDEDDVDYSAASQRDRAAELEDDLQALVAAELVASASSGPAGGAGDLDVGDELGVDDDDDVIDRGGELLDDALLGGATDEGGFSHSFELDEDEIEDECK